MIKIKNAGTHKKNNNQINFDFAFENSVRSRIATTVGLKTQQYIAICARPGVGKSWLAQNLIVDILSEMDENALYVSFEMSMEQLDKRFKLSYSDLYEDEIANHLNVIDEMITPEELEYAIKKTKPRVVVIDHINLVKGIKQYSSKLKQLAIKYNVLMLVCCQVNRIMDVNKEFTMSMIRDCGRIEQDADQVWYIPTNKDGIFVAKNREGISNIWISIGWDDEDLIFRNFDYNGIDIDYYKNRSDMFEQEEKEEETYDWNIYPVIKI